MPRKELYRDNNGIPFETARQWHIERTANWPTPERVKVDKQKLQVAFHDDFRGTPCWYCGERTGNQLHHLAAGSRGRSHERFLFCWTCSECHREHVGKDQLGRWLYLKWRYDPEHTSWYHIAVRLGFHLPDLMEG